MSQGNWGIRGSMSRNPESTERLLLYFAIFTGLCAMTIASLTYYIYEDMQRDVYQIKKKVCGSDCYVLDQENANECYRRCLNGEVYEGEVMGRVQGFS